MSRTLLFVLSSLVLTGLAHQTLAANPDETGFFAEKMTFELSRNDQPIQLRTGFFQESSSAEFKGCILYLEGLADSMRNHTQLFRKLSDDGYRIILFDYPGQGGSEGSMNKTRIFEPEAEENVLNTLRISNVADAVWRKFATVKNSSGKTCDDFKRVAMGWSMGGLAAYGLARDKWADAVVLIAPVLLVKPTVAVAKISLKTWTHATKDQLDPLVDPITPKSPALVPIFAANLLFSGVAGTRFKIDESVKGIVFISGPKDPYIFSGEEAKIFAKNAPHFKQVVFNDALHEIHNEKPAIRDEFQAKTFEFLHSLAK